MDAALRAVAKKRQRGHFLQAMKRATQRPKDFKKPAHWTNDPPPAPQEAKVDEELSPTRYGDWVKKGVAIDF